MPAIDRSVRSLMHLQNNASTARTLNLWSVWRKHGDSAEYNADRFFDSPILNRSIIMKHRLRPNEREIFLDGRATSTKVILPIDLTNLAAGARSFFINQNGYKECLGELSPTDNITDSRDEKLLCILDSLPSLDPFLMRERLSKEGFQPNRCYFDLTDADAIRMFDFVRSELTPLIGMSFHGEDDQINEKTNKLATKILANASDAELEPLRRGMGMSKADFEEGVFCWKGFIYYKWTLTNLLPEIRPVADQIAAIRPYGSLNNEDRAYISAVKGRLEISIGRACETVRSTLKVYDDSYHDLTRNGKPTAFRDFLLKAPELFYDLGERLGALNHIISFWRFRFPKGTRTRVDIEELIDLLADFEGSLCAELTELQTV